jgi:FMN phosphatase YigB (HAD superfamily)
LVHKDAERVLMYLKNRGLKLGLISNTGPTSGSLIRRFLETKHLSCFFDTMTFSDESGFAKPAREIFINTLTELGSNSEEAVHVGDDLNTDIFGANRAGLKTIWVQGATLPLSDKEIGRLPSPDEMVSDLSQIPRAVKNLYEGHS